MARRSDPYEGCLEGKGRLKPGGSNVVSVNPPNSRKAVQAEKRGGLTGGVGGGHLSPSYHREGGEESCQLMVGAGYYSFHSRGGL